MSNNYLWNQEDTPLQSWVWLYTTVVPATKEAEAALRQVRGQPEQLDEMPSQITSKWNHTPSQVRENKIHMLGFYYMSNTYKNCLTVVLCGYIITVKTEKLILIQV